MSRESGGSQRMRSTSMTEREARLLRRERIKMRNRDLIQRERNEMKRSGVRGVTSAAAVRHLREPVPYCGATDEQPPHQA